MAYQSPRTHLGARRTRLTLLIQETSDDGMGGQVSVDGFRPARTVWAREEPLDERTKEAIAAGQLTAKSGSFFDIAYRTDVTVQMRAQAGGQTYEINSVKNDDARKKRLLLYCTEIQS